MSAAYGGLDRAAMRPTRQQASGDKQAKSVSRSITRASTGTGSTQENADPVKHAAASSWKRQNTVARTAQEQAVLEELVKQAAASHADQFSSMTGMYPAMQLSYYPNLVSFVELYVAHVFPYKQGATGQFLWVSDWWRYPALVAALDAMWRSFEQTRQQPEGMMAWLLNAKSLFAQTFDRDTGIVASLGVTAVSTAANTPLPCQRPPTRWMLDIAKQLTPTRQAAAKQEDSTASDSNTTNDTMSEGA